MPSHPYSRTVARYLKDFLKSLQLRGQLPNLTGFPFNPSDKHPKGTICDNKDIYILLPEPAIPNLFLKMFQQVPVNLLNLKVFIDVDKSN